MNLNWRNRNKQGDNKEKKENSKIRNCNKTKANSEFKCINNKRNVTQQNKRNRRRSDKRKYIERIITSKCNKNEINRENNNQKRYRKAKRK